MEKQYQHTVNGQGVYSEDFNAMGEAGALADDRVLAELLRMLPKTGSSSVSRGIVPTAYSIAGGTDTATVLHGTGLVRIMPFRAVLGSSVLEATDGKENWRGIRSAVFVGGATSLGLDVAIPTLDAIGGAGTRWDVIVAKVMPDKSSTTVARKVKSPTDDTVATQMIVVNKTTEVTIERIAGTVGAGIPAVTADGGGAYYIELARIRLPAGYTTSSVLTQANIWDVAPCVAVSPATGAVSCRPASINNKPILAGIAHTVFPIDPATDFPSMYVPQSMCGAQMRMIALDFSCINSGDVIDDSMDWRGRLIQSVALTAATAGATVKFPWQHGTIAVNTTPFNHINPIVSMGQSFVNDVATGLTTIFVGAGAYSLHVDPTTGFLKVYFSTIDTSIKDFIWMTVSGQFSNRNPAWTL